MAKKRRKVARKKKGSSGAGWRRSPITAGIAILVILACMYITFGPSSGSSGFKGDYICTTCRGLNRLPFIREKEPHACVDCDAKTMYSALKCMDCGDIAASLPPLRDYTCTECEHNAEARLSDEMPHTCPKCNKKSFWETYYCSPCDEYFPIVDLELACPTCNGFETLPALEEAQVCASCEGENLGSVTPYAVIRWELGKTLTPEQEQEVEAWKAEQE